jgi:hypothetical protein
MKGRGFVGAVALVVGLLCLAYAAMCPVRPLFVADRWRFFVRDIAPTVSEEDVRNITETLAADGFRRSPIAASVIGLVLIISAIYNLKGQSEMTVKAVTEQQVGRLSSEAAASDEAST